MLLLIRHISYFENRHGEQCIFTCDRATGEARLRGGDAEPSLAIDFVNHRQQALGRGELPAAQHPRARRDLGRQRIASTIERPQDAVVHLRSVQALGGWRTLAMVQRYSHLAPDHLREAVERLAPTKAAGTNSTRIQPGPAQIQAGVS